MAYEESARIPLMVQYPPVTKGGHVDRDHLVSNGLDLFPTLCDIAGVDPPKDLPGLSLKPLLSTEPPTNWRKYLMIEGEVEAFERWRLSQRVAPIIVSLREALHEVGQHEIERFRRKLGGLEPSQEQAVEELTRAVIQKILHRPIRRLRTSVERGDTNECAELYREIFGLEPSAKPRPAEDQDPDGDTHGDDSRPGPHRLLRGGRNE